jgi:hypothetical protein
MKSNRSELQILLYDVFARRGSMVSMEKYYLDESDMEYNLLAVL